MSFQFWNACPWTVRLKCENIKTDNGKEVCNFIQTLQNFLTSHPQNGIIEPTWKTCSDVYWKWSQTNIRHIRWVWGSHSGTDKHTISWDIMWIGTYSSITNKMQRYTMVFTTINALHVSGGSSVYHQELSTTHANQFQLTHDSRKKQKKLDKYPMLYIQFWAPDDGQRNRLKDVEHL
jgi:hypothetical protein